MKNNAKYLEGGAEMHVKGDDLMDTAKPYHTGFLGYNFVAYANRDSTGYRERYECGPVCGHNHSFFSDTTFPRRRP